MVVDSRIAASLFLPTSTQGVTMEIYFISGRFLTVGVACTSNDPGALAELVNLDPRTRFWLEQH